MLLTNSLEVYSHEIKEFLRTTRRYLIEKLALIPSTKLLTNRYWVLATFEHRRTSPGNSSCAHQWERKISSSHHLWATEKTLADIRSYCSVPGSSKDFTYQEGFPTAWSRKFSSFWFCLRLTWKFVLPSKTSENGTINTIEAPQDIPFHSTS